MVVDFRTACPNVRALYAVDNHDLRASRFEMQLEKIHVARYSSAVPFPKGGPALLELNLYDTPYFKTCRVNWELEVLGTLWLLVFW